MGGHISKELIIDKATEVKDQLKTLPVTSWMVDNPWKSLGILIGTKFIVWDWLLFRIRNRDLPPGPMGLPVVGSIALMSQKMHEDLAKLGDKYGDVYYLRMPKRDFVILNSHQAIKEAFVKKGAEFSNRHSMSFLGFEDEIFAAQYDEEFKAHKKFAVNALRSFGFGTKALEDRIQTQIDKLCDVIRQQDGKAIDLEKPFQKATANVIMSILFNKQYSFEDPQIENVIKIIADFFEATMHEAEIMFFVPDFVAGLLSPFALRRVKQKCNAFLNLVDDQIKEHRRTFDPNDTRDFVDVYLKERDDIQDRTLRDTTAVFFPDAVHTTSIIIRWIMLYIVANPEVQEKIHKELDKVVGPSRNPSGDDRPNLNYIEATVRETMRFSNLIPMLPPHAPVDGATLNGFRIPKEVDVMANVYSVHFNEDIYPDPNVFKPERFLDENGKMTKTDTWLPFGAGPRMCMGEKLAKQEIFMIISNLFQKFHFKFPEDKPKPSLESMSGMFGVPQNYEVIATPR